MAAGLVLATGPLSLAQQPEPASPPAVPMEELPAGSEVLASGPVHEAFAKPVSLEPQTPLIVPNQPPANLQEVPPAERPDGADIVWVPGYWAWDADRTDYIWVSGCWRRAPPQTSWVPGHWLQVETGWEWIAGFWKPITAQPQQEMEYLPAPPAAVEVEAPGAAPAPDQIWVPGCWYWVQGQYVQRHGYWITQQDGWVWSPSHYAWTPRGYIFCAGHWDYDLDDRGVLFAPAYFPPAVRVQAGFVYSPGVCVDLGVLRLNLFTYPRYRHYYFGDYYDDAYRHVGIYPWFRCQTIHTWYDPIFVYDRWHFQRTDPHWAATQARQFELRRANHDLRPARTFTGLQAQTARLPANRRSERPLVQSVKSYAASQSTPIRFERISSAERQQIAVKSTEVRQLRDQRSHWEGMPTQPPAPKRGSPTETRLAPERTVGPAVGQPTTRPAPERTAVAPVGRPAPRPTRETKQPEVVSPERVRVTRPEREIMPNVSRAPQPSESRYIEKVPPRQPADDTSRVDPGSGRGRSADRDSQRKDRSDDSPGKDRDRR